MNKWHEGFRKIDMVLFVRALHMGFRCITYPRSLNQPDATKEEWHERTAMAIGLWTHIDKDLHSKYPPVHTYIHTSITTSLP